MKAFCKHGSRWFRCAPPLPVAEELTVYRGGMVARWANAEFGDVEIWDTEQGKWINVDQERRDG